MCDGMVYIYIVHITVWMPLVFIPKIDMQRPFGDLPSELDGFLFFMIKLSLYNSELPNLD